MVILWWLMVIFYGDFMVINGDFLWWLMVINGDFMVILWWLMVILWWFYGD